MMVASEVAMAMCMDQSADTPPARRMTSSTGTSTMPPPTPSRPATTPANSEHATSTSNHGQSARRSIGRAV